MSDFGPRAKDSSTSSDENIKTMLLAKFVISKTQWCFVNNGGIIITSELRPRSKDTL